MERLGNLQLKAERIFKKDKIKGLLSKIILKIRSVLYSTNSAIWFKKNLEENLKPLTSDINVQVDFHNKNIIQWLHDNHNKYQWIYVPKEIKSADTNQHLFATLIYNKTIIGYIKTGINKVYILDFDEDVLLPPDVAFIYDTFILPEYRGKNIIPFTIVKVISFLKQRGIKEVFCHIPKWNTASRRAFEKVGFKAIAYIRFWRAFKFKFLIKDIYRASYRIENLFYGFYQN